MRVCQFRHDGNLDLQCGGGPQGRRVRKTNFSILQACCGLSNHACFAECRRRPYPSFAVMEIFAFSTFDTGQPFSAASAYF